MNQAHRMSPAERATTVDEYIFRTATEPRIVLAGFLLAALAFLLIVAVLVQP